MTDSGQQRLNRAWYGQSRLSPALMPLGWLYAGAVAVRRRLFRGGLLKSFRVTLPVVIVGNLTAGGTGKTPITIWLVRALRDRGIRAGVVSRGYRGKIGHSPLPVMAHSDPSLVGDEPVLIATRAECPVVVHPDRVHAAHVLEKQGVDIIVADDGLQHYRLQRDFEIVVVDGQRGFGNTRPLPAGPMREPLSRLQEVDRVLVNADSQEALAEIPLDANRVNRFSLRATDVINLATESRQPLSELAGERVHAVAGIGNPDRFFAMLAGAGIDVIPHPLADHAELSNSDVVFADGLKVVMTEKDAVKCRHLELAEHWYVPVEVTMQEQTWVDEIAALVARPGATTPYAAGQAENDV